MNRKPWILGGIGVLVLVAVAALLMSAVGGVDAPAAPREREMTITFQLTATNTTVRCETGGTNGYSDIRPGMPVTVSNETGKIIASTTLPSMGEHVWLGCKWTMHVTVPDNAEQYGVTGGRRGTVTYSHEQLASQSWEVSLSVGNN